MLKNGLKKAKYFWPGLTAYVIKEIFANFATFWEKFCDFSLRPCGSTGRERQQQNKHLIDPVLTFFPPGPSSLVDFPQDKHKKTKEKCPSLSRTAAATSSTRDSTAGMGSSGEMEEQRKKFNIIRLAGKWTPIYIETLGSLNGKKVAHTYILFPYFFADTRRFSATPLSALEGWRPHRYALKPNTAIHTGISHKRHKTFFPALHRRPDPAPGDEGAGHRLRHRGVSLLPGM